MPEIRSPAPHRWTLSFPRTGGALRTRAQFTIRLAARPIRRIDGGWSSGSGRVRLFLRRAAWEVPVMTGPDEGGLAGRGHLRAAQADREQAITVLKAAYAQGRLTKDELEARAGQGFASRTYAELGGLTADLPAASPAGASPAGASRAATGPDAP